MSAYVGSSKNLKDLKDLVSGESPLPFLPRPLRKGSRLTGGQMRPPRHCRDTEVLTGSVSTVKLVQGYLARKNAFSCK